MKEKVDSEFKSYPVVVSAVRIDWILTSSHGLELLEAIHDCPTKSEILQN